MSVPSQGKPRLRMRVSAAAETALRSGHPWLYAEAIREQNRPGEVGELAVIYDRRNEFLAIGLYDPDSPLRARILHCGKPTTIDQGFWKARLLSAVERRKLLFDENTNGYRVIYGESDGWPGLVVDRYNTTYVVKLYTAAWLPWLENILPLFVQVLSPERIILRLSRNMVEQASEQGLDDGKVWMGPAEPETVVFSENGLYFEAEVIRGQKTGFFLDQRENRLRASRYANGRTVLNLFSFSGGFSVYAARAGAASVTDVDISAHALVSAKRNFALNRDLPNFDRCRHEQVQADVFDWLRAGNSSPADLVIVDPPSLARRAAEKSGALAAYSRLASGAISKLARNGVLVACSCTAQVSRDEFFSLVRDAARKSGRKHAEIETTSQPADHPIGFAEAEYLKGIYVRFEP